MWQSRPNFRPVRISANILALASAALLTMSCGSTSPKKPPLKEIADIAPATSAGGTLPTSVAAELDRTPPKRGVTDAELQLAKERAARQLLPLGVWLRVSEESPPMFSYVDPTAGPTIRGEMKDNQNPADTVGIAARVQWKKGKRMTEAERAKEGLPEQPEWVDVYGPQPPAGTYWGDWRYDARINHRLHSVEHPDDLMVLVFDDKPSPVEGVWVSVIACGSNACHGRVLNKPDALTRVAQGEVIAFPIDGRRDLVFLYSRNVTRDEAASVDARDVLIALFLEQAAEKAGKATSPGAD